MVAKLSTSVGALQVDEMAAAAAAVIGSCCSFPFMNEDKIRKKRKEGEGDNLSNSVDLKLMATLNSCTNKRIYIDWNEFSFHCCCLEHSDPCPCHVGL